ncbi:MAG: autotransporter outer membrane beta-barrel domain-containing protein [Cohaesibacteraceae bacterium]|nr:autotransporter outer membrane beta-barrel domain-containing protein [Cohaesibacteraceae bacterium]
MRQFDNRSAKGFFHQLTTRLLGCLSGFSMALAVPVAIAPLTLLTPGMVAPAYAVNCAVFSISANVSTSVTSASFTLNAGRVVQFTFDLLPTESIRIQGFGYDNTFTNSTGITQSYTVNVTVPNTGPTSTDTFSFTNLAAGTINVTGNCTGSSTSNSTAEQISTTGADLSNLIVGIAAQFVNGTTNVHPFLQISQPVNEITVPRSSSFNNPVPVLVSPKICDELEKKLDIAQANHVSAIDAALDAAIDASQALSDPALIPIAEALADAQINFQNNKCVKLPKKGNLGQDETADRLEKIKVLLNKIRAERLKFEALIKIVKDAEQADLQHQRNNNGQKSPEFSDFVYTILAAENINLGADIVALINEFNELAAGLSPDDLPPDLAAFKNAVVFINIEAAHQGKFDEVFKIDDDGAFVPTPDDNIQFIQPPELDESGMAVALGHVLDGLNISQQEINSEVNAILAENNLPSPTSNYAAQPQQISTEPFDMVINKSGHSGLQMNSAYNGDGIKGSYHFGDPSADQPWVIFLNTSGSLASQNRPGSRRPSRVWNIALGFQRRLNPVTVIGMTGAYTRGHVKATATDTRLDVDYVSLAFAGIRQLENNYNAKISATYTHGRNDIRVGTSEGTFNTDAFAAKFDLSKIIELSNQIKLAMGLSAGVKRVKTQSYTNDSGVFIPGTDVTGADASASTTLSKTFVDIGKFASITSSLGLSASFNYRENFDATLANGKKAKQLGLGATLTSGFDFAMDHNINSSIGASYSLFQDNVRSWSLTGKLNIPLN